MQSAILPQRQATNENNPACVVTLVHGTFDPDAKWTHAGSPLRQTIESNVAGKVLFKRFTWASKHKHIRWCNNTHQDRYAASLKLRQHLESDVKQYPEAKHFVIAHSHGGNVAVEALRGAELAGRIHGVVCLATPFFVAERSERDKYIALVASGMRQFGWLTFLFLFWISSTIVSHRLAFIPNPVGKCLSLTAVTFLGKGVHLVHLAACIGGAFTVWKWAPGWINHGVGPWLARRQNYVARRYDTSHLANIPMLCVCVKRDEARLALRAERWGERAMTHGYRWALCGAFLLSIILCGVLTAAKAGELSGSISASNSSNDLLPSLVFSMVVISITIGSYVSMALLLPFFVL